MVFQLRFHCVYLFQQTCGNDEILDVADRDILQMGYQGAVFICVNRHVANGEILGVTLLIGMSYRWVNLCQQTCGQW